MSTAPIPPVKPGWQTTEFWQTIILQALALLTITGILSPAESAGIGSSFTVMIQNIVAIIVAGGTVISYIGGRTKIKVGG